MIMKVKVEVKLFRYPKKGMQNIILGKLLLLVPENWGKFDFSSLNLKSLILSLRCSKGNNLVSFIYFPSIFCIRG